MLSDFASAVVFAGDRSIAPGLVRKLASARVLTRVIVGRTSDTVERDPALGGIDLPATSDTERLRKEIARVAPRVAFLLMPGVTEPNDEGELARALDTMLAAVELCGRAGCRYFVGVGSIDESAAFIAPPGGARSARYAAALVGLTGGLTVTEIAPSWGGSAVWLRLPEVYGPGATGTVTDMIEAALFGTPLTLDPYNDPVATLYVDDAVEAVLAAASIGLNGIHAVTCARRATLRELADVVRVETGSKEPLHARFADAGLRRVESEAGHFGKVTGWSPRTDLHAGVSQTVNWYRRRKATRH